MADQATKEKELDTQRKLLAVTVKKTPALLAQGEQEPLLRNMKAIRKVVENIEEIRLIVEGLKISNDEETEDWEEEINQELTKSDEALKEMNSFFKTEAAKKSNQANKEKIDMEQELLNVKLQYEAKKLDIQKAAQTVEQQLKLPKLEITKFAGDQKDWMRFYNQFVESVDKRQIPEINKLGYLQGYLAPNVLKLIEGLPHTDTGYEQSKQILEEKYGRPAELAQTYIKELIDMPEPGKNLKAIHSFCDRYVTIVNGLRTLGKLNENEGLAQHVLRKLAAIRDNLIGHAEDHETWKHADVLKTLQRYVRMHPIEETDVKPASQHFRQVQKTDTRPRRIYTTSQYTPQCVYCDSKSHKATDCDKITDPEQRRKELMRTRRCFNCTGTRCRAGNCRSNARCRVCQAKHHTSLHKDVTSPEIPASQTPEKEAHLTASTKGGEALLPILIVKINGVLCRAMVDSGAGNSYASREILESIKVKPFKTVTKQIEMLLTTKTVKLSSYQATISPVEGTFELPLELTRVDKQVLLEVPNPHYPEIIKAYPHLKGVKIIDNPTKELLPIHIILGSGDYSKIKTNAQALVGRVGDPVAEKTRLGWFLMSPGEAPETPHLLFAQTSQSDYDELCRMDVLGLADRPCGDQETVYREFQETLTRDKEGWYETPLPWKGNHPPLHNNYGNSLRRLATTERKLQRANLLETYDAIIKDQLQTGVIEKVQNTATGTREFYLPHRAVVRDAATSTKVRVVYDGSARGTPDAPSLNECLNVGPPLNNELWDILVRQRIFPIIQLADITKAFLQIRVRKADRDAMRFHWREQGELITYRFARVLFGLTCSPFLLNGVLDTHLRTWAEAHPEQAEELRRSLFVDDLVTGGTTIAEVQGKKDMAVQILEDATFTLHKFASNKAELHSTPTNKILGVGWDPVTDTLKVSLDKNEETPTKRTLLSRLARIYDPLGLAGPLSVEGKQLYRQACDSKIAWDTPLPADLLQKFHKWEASLPSHVTVPRALAPHREPITEATLHGFGDASQESVACTVYAVLTQSSGITQRLIAAKTRLAKRELTIPRKELVAAQMTTNLLRNVHQCLKPYLPTTTSLYAWSDSTVVLWWLRGSEQYRQFVSNRVRKIQEAENVEWRHVPTQDNPADLGSRGGPITQLWLEGPCWLPYPETWPVNPVVASSPAAEAETKQIREVLCPAITSTPQVTEGEQLMKKYPLNKTLRILSYVRRFIRIKTKQHTNRGPLDYAELKAEEVQLVKNAQQMVNRESYPDLNLVTNEEGLLICQGRVRGHHPLFLPPGVVLAGRIIERAHKHTLHGGVISTMSHVRQKYWIPKLRSQAKRVRAQCHGCRRQQAQPYAPPSQAQLPSSRTTVAEPYQVIGVDYAGPLYYQKSAKVSGKAYLVIYACALTRGVYLELVRSQETTEFLLSLKKFIARRGRPKIIYSDNGLTFKAAATWIEKARTAERVMDTLAKHEISWRFNLAKAPWWGGHYERLIGVFKNTMYRVIGHGLLSFDQLTEVVLDIETVMNNRPLQYLENDVDMPTLTPNSFIQGGSQNIPELPVHLEAIELRREAKRLKAAKDAVWARWQKEYLTALREVHKGAQTSQVHIPPIGEIVIIKEDRVPRNLWKLAKVIQHLTSRDGKVRGVRLQTTKGTLERPIQHIYSMELSTTMLNVPSESSTVTTQSKEHFPQRRAAAVTAAQNTACILDYEDEDY